MFGLRKSVVDILRFRKTRKHQFELKIHIFKIPRVWIVCCTCEIGSTFLLKNLEKCVNLRGARESVFQIDKLIRYDTNGPIISSECVVRVS